VARRLDVVVMGCEKVPFACDLGVTIRDDDARAQVV
jgi:hypothetical protein